MMARSFPLHPLRAGVLDRIGRALADGARAALRAPEPSNTPANP